MVQNSYSETSLVIPVTPEFIERRIYIMRGQKVMLDKDLAELYLVGTRDLNKAVKRNEQRFPADFMFQLNKKEFEILMFQFGTSRWGGTRKLPYVFTELGVGMLSSVLKSDRAVQMNIYIVRAFVKLREVLATHKDIAEKIEALEKGQKKNSEHLIAISSVLKKMMEEPKKEREPIGFRR